MNGSERFRLWRTALALCACMLIPTAGLWGAAVNESEPNDTAGSANALLFGTNPAAVAVGTLLPASDIDFYSFSAQAGSRVWAHVDTGGAATGASRDSQLRLFAGDGTTELEFDDDDGTGNGLDGTSESGQASVIAGFIIPSTGTYYLRVNESGGDGTIEPYRLYVAVTTSALPELDTHDSGGNDSPNASNSLSPVVGVPFGGVSVRTGAFDSTSDQDYYFVHAVQGDVIFVALDGNPERDGTNLDADLALFDTNGISVLLEADSDSGSPLAEGFAFEVPATGVYYVRVRDIGATDTGTYAVMAARVDSSVCTWAGKGNFDNLFGADLVFRQVSTNRNKVWLMNGAARLSEAFISPDPVSVDWRVVGSDDFYSDPLAFNPDRQTDLVFYNVASGAVEFWPMNGTTRASAPVPLTGAAPLPLDWKLSATGDFNSDGRPDLVWRSFTTQKVVIWTMGAVGGPTPSCCTQMIGTITPTPDQAVDSNWELVAALDLNNDNQRDFLWYNYSSGRIVTWYLNGSLVRTSGQFTAPNAAGDNNWKVYAGGDYSWNYNPGAPPYCSPDLVWRNQTSGRHVVWHMNSASTRVHGAFTNPDSNPSPLDWELVGPR